MARRILWVTREQGRYTNKFVHLWKDGEEPVAKHGLFQLGGKRWLALESYRAFRILTGITIKPGESVRFAVDAKWSVLND